MGTGFFLIGLIIISVVFMFLLFLFFFVDSWAHYQEVKGGLLTSKEIWRVFLFSLFVAVILVNFMIMDEFYDGNS